MWSHLQVTGMGEVYCRQPAANFSWVPRRLWNENHRSPNPCSRFKARGVNKVTLGQKAHAAFCQLKMGFKCDSSQRCFPLLSRTTNKAFTGWKSLLPVCDSSSAVCPTQEWTGSECTQPRGGAWTGANSFSGWVFQNRVSGMCRV